MLESGSTEIQNQIHSKISQNLDRVRDWFAQQRKGHSFPFYSSFDVRDSGFKVAPVDANIYPAGFNNICRVDREAAGPLVDMYLKSHYGDRANKICLLAEQHTNNLYYWDNVAALKTVIESSGRDVRVSIPKPLEKMITIKSASGRDVEIYPFIKTGEKVYLGEGFEPELVISNNDFSDAHESWAQGLTLPVNPPRELGWYQRKKSLHFEHYNKLANEFAELIGIDPWTIQVRTEVLFDSDLGFVENRESAAQAAQKMLDQIARDYKERGIQQEPVLFVKNNSGTYGLAVAQVKSGDEIMSWNSKSRTKMKAAKGGDGVTELILQEGIPSGLKVDGQTCEPAIYMLGCELAGGFLRAHGEKGPTESLNSPGAVYKRLCVTDLKVDVEGKPMENVYGWVSKLSSLAIGREAKDMNVVYTEYNIDGSCPRS